MLIIEMYKSKGRPCVTIVAFDRDMGLEAAKTVEPNEIKKMAEQIVNNCVAGILDGRGGFITYGVINLSRS